MERIVQFAILGLGLGGIYALIALGLVLVYRGSGVVNFANTGLTLLSAVVFYETYGVGGWPVVPAILLAVAASTAAGFVMQFGIMRPLKNASSLMRTVAMLAVLAIIESAVDQVYGGVSRTVTSFLPDGAFHLFGTAVGQDRLIILGLSCVLTLVLWLVYRLTRFGLATTAVAANDVIPASLGWSPNRIASANWAIGAGLAGLAGVLISPIVGLNGDTIAVMIVPALTVALIAGFSSFPLTLAGGLILGVLQSETTLASWAPVGASDFVPLILIVVILVLRGKSIPLRGYLADRLPRLGSGQIHPLLLVIGLVVLWLSAQVFTTNWVGAVTTTFIAAIICLSLVVVTGFCGQLSLAQYAFAGLGALFAAHIAASWHLEFILTMLVAFLATAVIGAFVALPAIRLRGVNLAVVTLSVAVVANSAILENPTYTGGYFGITVPSPSIFGLDVDAVNHPGRYAVVVIIVFCVAAVAVANLRRGRVGRRLVAVRSNERAATSLGVSVAGAKLYAFALGAAIAAIGGSLLIFESSNAYFGGFSPLASINVVLQAVVGGIGYASGAFMGGVSASSGMGQQALSTFFNTQGWFTVYAGVLLLIIVITHHDGVVDVTIISFRKAKALVLKGARRVFPSLGVKPPKPGGRAVDAPGGGLAAGPGPAAPVIASGARLQRVDLRSMFDAKTLEMRGVGITFGGVVAVDDFNLTVNPGEVVGLIGPNGAGKTTILDIATGFHSRYRGSVLLGGQPVDKVKAVGRSRAGLMRSFQNLELFDDLTVEENIRTACEPRDRLSYVRDLVLPKKSPLGPLADAVIEEFGLTTDLDRKPTDLHLAQRRLLAVARVIAARPAVLLLDEPAAGLDETSRAELGEVIRWLADSWGLGVLLIEHDVALVVSTCDRVVALDFGKVVAADTAQNIASHDGVIKSYLGTSSESGERVTTPNLAEGAAPGGPVTVSIETPQ